jgi:hypothetical protein
MRTVSVAFSKLVLSTTIAFILLRSTLQGRMYGNGKGIADSALPYKRTPPSWLKTTAGEVQDHGEPHALLGLCRCARAPRWLMTDTCCRQCDQLMHNKSVGGVER